MKQLKNAKKVYDAIEIPKQLNQMVEDSIQRGSIHSRAPKKYFNWKPLGYSAAAILFCFTVGLNTNEAFAKSFEEIAVIGPIARILTFRSYEHADEDKTVLVEVPQIENSMENTDFTDQINAEIQTRIDAYIEQANQDIADYKEAFLATGGTEQEFTSKGIKVDVDYEIKSQTDTTVSFIITANENWSSAYGVQYFYNLDLAEGTVLTLEQILGEQYVSMVNESIKTQMQERVNADSNCYYFTVDEGGFETIGEETNFYLNENGNPVIVFGKYEIAPGSMGIQEFEITK